MAIEALRRTPAIGDEIEVDCYRRGQLRASRETVRVERIADDQEYTLPTAYCSILVPEVDPGVRRVIETVYHADQPIRTWADAERLATRPLSLEAWGRAIGEVGGGARVLELSPRGAYRLTEYGRRVARGL